MTAFGHPVVHAPHYFVPTPSGFPVRVAVAVFFVFFGLGPWINGAHWGAYATLLGLLLWGQVLQQWFRQTIKESQAGLYSDRVDVSYRWAMCWFIFSEVMFFGAFFAALYWLRAHALPSLGDSDNALLWPGFKGTWPNQAPGLTGAPADLVEPYRTVGPWPIPTLNTALLLSSGVTLTMAHHALIADARSRAVACMWVTLLLGASFLGLQVFEYHHAYAELNLTLASGTYGSTFFLLTGFHGFHVFVGAMMLLFITIRLMQGHFTPERHFGFQGAAWYWHFVDAVWLGLYLVVYWF